MPAMGRKCLVDLGDGDRFDRIVAIGADDGVGRIDGHPHAGQLVLVDLVAAALGHRLHQAHHADARLQGVVAGDQAHVSPADDKEPFGGADQVTVDQRLESAGAIDAGQGVALEGQRFFPGARRDQQHLRR